MDEHGDRNDVIDPPTRSPGRAIAALLVWNVGLLTLWIGKYHPDPSEIVRTVRSNFPASGPLLATLGSNWGHYVLAILVTLGFVSIAQVLGSALSNWRLMR